MAESQDLQAAKQAFAELSQQCAPLGIWLWQADAQGRILTAPADAPAKASEVASTAAILAMSPKPLPAELSPGRWLIPIECRTGTTRILLNFALLPTTEPQDVMRISTMLKWMQDRIIAQMQGDLTIEQFSEKLSQAYEETDLLYRMARLLNCGTDATKAIQTIGSQLQEVLPFGWMAIRFSPTSRGVSELAGQTIIAGEPPIEADELGGLMDQMFDSPLESWKKVHTPQRDELARRAGSEVVSEPITHDEKVIGVMLAGGKRGDDPDLSSVEIKFLDATADFLSVFHENLSRFSEQQEMFIGTLQALTASIDAKDPYTMGHSQRVGLMASKMATAMGLEKSIVEQYRIAGLVHDVGKIGVPEAVLTKPARLTSEEFDLIKLHPAIGHRILNQIPSLAPVLPGVLYHHERWDGRGYPDRLAGQEIPLIARVLALADTFDAMSSNRAYRPAMPRPKVLEEIVRNAGAQFDPQLAPIFVKLDFTEFDRSLGAIQSRDQKAA